MFNKLRNNYVMTNMAVISTVIIIAFTIIYSITYNNAFNEKKQFMDEISKREIQIESSEVQEYVRSDYSLIYLDKEYNYLLTDHFVENTREIVSSTESNNDFVKLKNKDKYLLAKRYILNEPIEHEGEEIYYYIIFVDTTVLTNQMSNLLKIMIIILFLVLGFVFLICVYLANKSVKNIKEAWDKQRQFIADASHELKTPITIITSNAEALVLETEENKWINNIKHETKRMISLITNLLYLSKIEDFEINLESEVLDLSKIMNDVLLTYEVKAFENHIKLELEIQDNIVLKADQERLKQLIHILMDNAIKYTHESGIIDVKLKQEFNQITLSVENTGVGIKEEDIPYVFDRFYKTDQSRVSSSNSYGLGLSIAKAIVLRMNGEIFVQSVENQKTKFTIIFDL